MSRSATDLVFRAISRKTGQFNYWSMALITQASEEVKGNFFAENDFDMATLGQWAGERLPQAAAPDIPGEMVFEGDILFHHSHWNECDCNKNWKNYIGDDGKVVKPLGKAEGCKDGWSEYTEVIFDHGGFDPFPWAGQEGNPGADAYIVVGNRHQNPELLSRVER